MSAGDILGWIVLVTVVALFGWLPAMLAYRAVRRQMCRPAGCSHETGADR